MSKLDELLKYLENNMDTEHIEKNIRHHKKALNFEKIDYLPLSVSYPQNEFKSCSIPEIHEDFEKMMFNELLRCIAVSDIKDGSHPTIRANYGVGIMPSLFGVKSRIVDNNMPWVEHVDSEDDIKEIVSKGIPDIKTGFGGKIFELHEFFKEKLADYPKCSKYIRINHPDLQGPFDIAHLVWGSDIYLAVYDYPELLKEFLELITETYIKILKEIKKGINDEADGFVFDKGKFYKGRVVIRNDSAVNLSKDMYKEFIKPYDEKILKAFGSGAIHFCGRADHWVFDAMETRGNCSMNFGYMPNKVFGETYLEFLRERFTASKMPIVEYVLSEEEFKSFNRQRFNTGMSLHTSAKSRDEACEMLKMTMN
mgnify:CR=1 FL=1